MTYDTILEAAAENHLEVLGGFHPTVDDGVPVPCATLLLLGPRAPGFWPAFTARAEWNDGAPDPMDRWSRQVIDGLATALDATALYPFGGAPFLPFYSWALRTGRAHPSPIQFLVHDTQGLMVSFRGALALKDKLDLPPAPDSPCATCQSKPCLTACPVDALGARYDVAACKAFLDTDAGSGCMETGCAARRTCPVSQRAQRPAAQSAYHMRQFRG